MLSLKNINFIAFKKKKWKLIYKNNPYIYLENFYIIADFLYINEMDSLINSNNVIINDDEIIFGVNKYTLLSPNENYKQENLFIIRDLINDYKNGIHSLKQIILSTIEQFNLIWNKNITIDFDILNNISTNEFMENLVL